MTSQVQVPIGTSPAIVGFGASTTTFTVLGLYPTSAGSCNYDGTAPAAPINTALGCSHASQTPSSLSSSQGSSASSQGSLSSSQTSSTASATPLIETWAILYVPKSTPTSAFCLEGDTTKSSLIPLQTCGPSTSSLTASANCQELFVCPSFDLAKLM